MSSFLLATPATPCHAIPFLRRPLTKNSSVAAGQDVKQLVGEIEVTAACHFAAGDQDGVQLRKATGRPGDVAIRIDHENQDAELPLHGFAQPRRRCVAKLDAIVTMRVKFDELACSGEADTFDHHAPRCRSVNAILLAAGYGTRIRSLSPTRPRR